ncbi:MAG TPA: MFS transporter [Ktedonobacteraceae bacterium]|nr:MFS transporter [Ktedonobacteraceae bacterium]
MSTTTPAQANAGGKFQAPPTRGQARFAFTVLLIINILNYADRYVLSAVLPKIHTDLGLTTVEEGLLGSSFLFVYALATLPIGVWADRSVRKNIVGLCVGIWSVATVLAGITRNFIQLFLVRSVLGIGEAGYAPASLSLLGDYFSKERRGRVLSFWSAGTLIGAAIGFTLGGFIAEALSWRWAFYVVGIPGLICAFLAWRMTEPARGAFDVENAPSGETSASTSSAHAHGSIGKDFWGTVKRLSKVRTYWVLVGALVFSFFTIGGTSFWLPTYIVNDFHLKVSEAGLLSGLVLVTSGLVGTIVGGWLADTFQKRIPQGRLLVATLGLLIGAPLVMIALFLHTIGLFVVVFILAGITLNFCTGPLNAVIQDVISPEMRSTAIGLALLLAHLLGDAASPSVIGGLASGSSLWLALITTAPTSLFIAGLICLLGLRTVGKDMDNMKESMLTSNQA